MKTINVLLSSGMIGQLLEQGEIGPGGLDLSRGFRVTWVKKTSDDYPVDGVFLTIEILDEHDA